MSILLEVCRKLCGDTPLQSGFLGILFNHIACGSGGYAPIIDIHKQGIVRVYAITNSKLDCGLRLFEYSLKLFERFRVLGSISIYNISVFSEVNQAKFGN